MWEVIQKHLNEQNLSLRGLARKAGVHHNSINNLKNGKSHNPSFDLIRKISIVLNIDMNEFKEE